MTGLPWLVSVTYPSHFRLIIEDWRAVVGYEGIYEVSSMGRVRSLPRAGADGRRLPGRMLKLLQDRRERPYPSLMLCDGVGAKTNKRVHNLVAEAFLGPRLEGLWVCHNNGDKQDNRVENLRYDTASENNRDTVRHGNNHNARKGHCPQGHPYDEANTRLERDGRGRRCRACHNERSKRAARQGRAA